MGSGCKSPPCLGIVIGVFMCQFEHESAVEWWIVTSLPVWELLPRISLFLSFFSFQPWSLTSAHFSLNHQSALCHYNPKTKLN